MSVLYVKEQGSYVKKSGETVEVMSRQNERLLTFPVANLDGLSVFGNVQLTTQALAFLLENGVDVSLFSRNGTLIGQVLADASKNIFLRLAQYDAYQDFDIRMGLARVIICNKIENQCQLIQHYRYKDGFSPQQELGKMEKLKRKLETCMTSNEILGVEGMCSNIYFSCFAHMVSCNFEFSGRNRRPPKDPINVILSLGYTFLTREVCTALEAESFEVYLGFLHGVRYGRKSLALDMVEEFRQPVVDRFVIRSFNKRILNEFDFEVEEDKVTLAEEGFSKFCREFENWMTGRKSVQPVNYRKLIRSQAAGLKKALRDKTDYTPYHWEGGRDLCDQL
ncbi:MAG: CRISPR-associated endonuclease Cas1 [Lachnospiraceae bacterium]|nr:CRISPR-associated endonuclease Cas1 [Lachnospiraceae bacterium]